jgi:hypothetical protein
MTATPWEGADGGLRKQEREFHAVLEYSELDFERVRNQRQVGGSFKDHLSGQSEFFQVRSLEFVNCRPRGRVFAHVQLSCSLRYSRIPAAANAPTVLGRHSGILAF